MYQWVCFVFFFIYTSTTDIYTLSLHDALPILFPDRLARGVAIAEDLDAEQSHGHGHTVEIGFQLLEGDRKSTRLNSSHVEISYAVFCLKKKKNTTEPHRQSCAQCEFELA